MTSAARLRVTRDDEYVHDIRDGAADGNMMRSEDCPRSLQLLGLSQYGAQLIVPGADYWDFQAGLRSSSAVIREVFTS